MDIGHWLQALGLGQYEAAFRDNAIDPTVLSELTADDLKEIGVVPVGHRRKLLSAIAALAGSAPREAESDHAVQLRPATHFWPERRQLSVLFCDLVGSTELSRRFELEDYRHLIGSFQETCAKAITQFEGYVAKYMGDGLLAYFGYPVAHENDASRAVRAGLALVESVQSIRLAAGVERLRVRVGIATGLVVVGDLIGAGSAQEQSIAGETPNLAARLQSLAPPDSVIIAESTRRLVGSEFQLDDLGPTSLKGFAEPIAAYRVLGRGLSDRFSARTTAASPLVGRQEEISLLLRRWEQAHQGEGQVALISGEAGIGKSRVIRGLLTQIALEQHNHVQLQCSPYFGNSALHPFATYLEDAAGFHQQDDPGEKRDKLQKLLQGTSVALETTAPILAGLLSIPTTPPTEDYDARRANELTVEALIEYLVALGSSDPLLLLVEDIHWADPTTLDLLNKLVDRISHCRALILVTHRPEFSAQWRGHPQVTSITINRLSRRQAVDFISRMSTALPEGVVEQLVARSDGIPLYLEELTKAVLEGGALVGQATLSSVPIPATLQDSLMARLDRYPAAKRVAQSAAVIGREFAHSLLTEIAGERGPELEAGLQQLVSAELVFARGTPPDALYTFKHALVRDAAYESLLKTSRQELHARIADTLEADQHLSSRQPELVAYHLSEARLHGRAASYWVAAADSAAARHAHQEVIGHCNHGLEAVRLIPDETMRLRHELQLQVRLGTSARWVSWGAPEAARALYRARELCAELQDYGQLPSILVGLFYFHSNHAELLQAEALGLELLTLGETHGNRVHQAYGHMVLVDSRYKLAKFYEARYHLERGMELYTSEGWPKLTVEAWDDPRPNLLIYGGAALWMLGYPERAQQTVEEAVLLARRAGHRLSIAHAVYMAGHLAELRGDWQEVKRSNSETIALAEEWGLTGLREAVGRRDRLVSVALLDDPEEIAYKRTNPQPGFARSFHDGVLAQALGRIGRTEEALEVVEAALRWSEETSSFFFHAELHRLWAQLLTEDNQLDRAQHVLTRSIEIARQQGARMWELRASRDLAVTLKNAGRNADARALLEAIVVQFSEPSPELQSTRELLLAIC